MLHLGPVVLLSRAGAFRTVVPEWDGQTLLFCVLSGIAHRGGDTLSRNSPSGSPRSGFEGNTNLYMRRGYLYDIYP